MPKNNLFSDLFPKPMPVPQWLKDVGVETKSFCYECPECKTEPPEGRDEGWTYEINGDEWPKIFNYHSYGNDMGSGYDWTEYHKCQECGTIYWFNNGT